MTDHFCYVIDEVTTESDFNSSSERSSSSLSEESDMESSDEEQPVIRRRYHGYRPPGIPSCIKEQKEETLSSSGSNFKKEILEQSENCKFMLEESSDQSKCDATYKQDHRISLEKRLVASEEITGPG